MNISKQPSFSHILDKPSFTGSQDLKILHYNIQSLLPKIDELRYIVKKANFDCISLNETFLDTSVSDNELKIEGIFLFRKDKNSHGGGTALYIGHKFQPEILTSLNTDVESVWISIRTKNGDVIIGSVYRPPSVKNEYYEQLVNDFDAVSSTGKDIVILGDFNLNCYNDGYNCHKKIEHLENSFMLKQIIAEPTRVTPTSSTLIDLLLISRHLHPTYSGVLHQYLSDHYGIYVSLPVRPQSEPSKTVTLRNLKNIDRHAFIYEIASSTILNSIHFYDDVYTAWNLWKTEYLRICNTFAPI